MHTGILFDQLFHFSHSAVFGTVINIEKLQFYFLFLEKGIIFRQFLIKQGNAFFFIIAGNDHIAAHSTGHSEAILTRDEAHAALFTAAVDSAAVYVNCSTRFTDGGEFGLGCEMGISTQKLHARGPMGLEELCSYKYIIHGSGQIR